MKHPFKLILLIIFFALRSIFILAQTKEFKIQLNKHLILFMKITAFNVADHDIKKCLINNKQCVCLIDNKIFFGTDWTLPTNQLDCLTLKIDSNKIDLDVSSMYNPWFGDYSPKEHFKFNKIEGGFEVRGLFSDGAGSYVSEWKIIDGKSIRTLISNNEDLVIEFLNSN